MKDKFIKAIKRSNGKLFTVVFLKKDGTERLMLGKVGVKRHLSKKVGKKSYKRSNSDHVAVYDMESKGYRTVDTFKVSSFRCGKVIIQ